MHKNYYFPCLIKVANWGAHCIEPVDLIISLTEETLTAVFFITSVLTIQHSVTDEVTSDASLLRFTQETLIITPLLPTAIIVVITLTLIWFTCFKGTNKIVWVYQ